MGTRRELAYEVRAERSTLTEDVLEEVSGQAHQRNAGVTHFDVGHETGNTELCTNLFKTFNQTLEAMVVGSRSGFEVVGRIFQGDGVNQRELASAWPLPPAGSREPRSSKRSD